MLPRPLTSFVGRTEELAVGCAGVEAHPLVTIIGPPGVGKTRLAIEIAYAASSAFGGRASFVDLAPVSTGALVGPSLLAALGIPARGLDVPGELARQLGAEPALIVLDNCEHLREAVAELVLAVLNACPGLHVLATSRAELGIAGEQLVVLGPFQDSRAEPSPDALTLFRDRARSSAAVLDDSAATREAVRLICRRVDGLPLAIELAAARVRVLGLTQLDAILTQPLRALSAAPRRSSPPQRSLRDSITWSYELCDPEERLAWEALSVFAGSFDLAAASAVLRQVADREPVELIEALVARSILTTTPEGATRYRMLVVLREYGREQLRVRGVEQQVREAHAGWYAHIGAELEANWVGPGQGERLRRAEIELPNIREAAQFALAADRPELLAGLVVQPAAQLWWTTGRLDEGLYWLRRVLAVHHRPDAVRIHALIQASTFALVLGALDEGEALARELADRARGSGDAFWLGATAFVEGFAAIQRRDYRAAVDILRGGVRIGDGHDDLLRMRLRNRQMLAFALNAVRRDAEAAQVCDEILTLGTAAGDGTPTTARSRTSCTPCSPGATTTRARPAAGRPAP